MDTLDDFERAFAEMTDGPPPPAEETPAAGSLAAADAEPLAAAPEPAADAAPEAVAEPTPPAESEEPAKPPKLEDLLAALPAEQQARFKPVVEAATRDLHRLKSDDGRVAAMQRLYEQAKARDAEWQAKMAGLEAKVALANTPAQQEAAKAEIVEEQDTLERDYPELAKAFNLRMERMLKKLAPPPAAPVPQAAEPTATAPAQVPPPPKADDAEVTALAREYEALSDAHPDWQNAVNSPEFAVWFRGQPPGVQSLLGSPNSQDAIWMLNQFKGTVADAKRRAEADRKVENRKRLEQNVGVRGQPPRVNAVPDEFEAAFNFYANQR